MLDGNGSPGEVAVGLGESSIRKGAGEKQADARDQRGSMLSW